MKFKIPLKILLNFLKTNFGEVKTTATGEWRVNSPFASDNKQHLYIEPNKGVVFDFKSGFKGDVISFISEFLQIGKKDVIPTLLKEYGLKGEFNDLRVEDYVNKAEDLVLPKGLKFFSEEKHGIIRDQAYNYLLNRGIPEENIQEFGYVYEPNTEFDRTVFIPFFENGRIVYFTARDFTGKNFKRYTNPHGVNSKQFVYNYDRIEDTVFIFEGVLDAISLQGQVGTAMLSADIGREQCIKILNRAPNTIVFVPDNDETGEKTLQRNINLLMKFKPPSLDFKIKIYRIKDAKDFNESGEHHIYLMKCEDYKPKDLRKAFSPRKSTII
jgi:DNA primase